MAFFVFRHWKELMTKTGQNFEMNPDTFTLQSVFTMELHRFQEAIGEITNKAVKELAIEKVSHASSSSLCFNIKNNSSQEYILRYSPFSIIFSKSGPPI